MSATDFSKFPLIGNGCRLVGTTLMDEEQFNVEEWAEVRKGDWRPTLEGLQRYGQLREKRRQDRRADWQARQEEQDNWSKEIERMIEREP